MRYLINLVNIGRPHQWTKNVFVLAALVFSRNLFNTEALIHSIYAFFVFCLASSTIYYLNDIIDRDKDRKHPVKRDRPIASGAVSVNTAGVVMSLLFITSLFLARGVSMPFFWVILLYFLLEALYCFVLKDYVILDIFGVAGGFFLRVIGGAAAILVEPSSWLLVCSTLLALFLSTAKRRYELLLLDTGAGGHRSVLEKYSKEFLDQIITVVVSATIIAYALYTISEVTVEKFGTERLLVTLPFVIYGLFRYLYLIDHKNEGGQPEKLLLKDMPSLINMLLWITAVAVTVYSPGGFF